MLFVNRVKEAEETTLSTLNEPETVTEFPPLDEDIFTQPIHLDKSKWLVTLPGTFTVDLFLL